MLKIRRPLGRLIFNMGIAIPGKTVFLIETAPRWFNHIKCMLHIWGSLYPNCNTRTSAVTEMTDLVLSIYQHLRNHLSAPLFNGDFIWCWVICIKSIHIPYMCLKFDPFIIHLIICNVVWDKWFPILGYYCSQTYFTLNKQTKYWYLEPAGSSTLSTYLLPHHVLNTFSPVKITCTHVVD